ncbi:DUF3618 domain-containing protein [Actinomyces polynesiensis]|uniref:DUF3618 domain-containing protein n=1 Tax=Actinomyces polynesiensis TaxID=1325934 RepID=UPI0005BD1856|nr:DUF3618 domain-containing protein [Actinomyces polynesiensis]
MSDEDIRTPEQIQAELAATRAQMSATVDELVQTLKPSTQVRRATSKLRSAALDLRDQVVATTQQALDGDRDALVRVGVVAASVAGLVGLCVLGRVRHRS